MASRDARGSPRDSSAAESPPPPLVQPVHVRTSTLAALPPSRLSHSSSSGSSRRFASQRRAPALRRSQAQDSDPCMLGASFDDWTDDDDEETKDERVVHTRRPLVQRSQTDKTGALALAHSPVRTDDATTLAPSPVAPLTIRIRKFASTSALDFRTAVPLTTETTDALPLPPVSNSIATLQRDDSDMVVVLEEGGVDDSARDRNDELLRASRFESSQFKTQRGPDEAANPESGPPRSSVAAPTGPTRWYLAWASNPRFRRWYGRILNSYFAFWLVVCSLAVAVLEMILLLALVVMERKKTEPREVKLKWCHELRRDSLGPIHYIGAAACVALVLPVLFPINVFELYRKRMDRRMIRRPYLHLCELFVAVEIGYLIYFFLSDAYRLPFTANCHDDLLPSEITFLYATLLLWCVMWWQLIVFCRFLVHLKLQADAANDAIHTSAVSDWLKLSNHREVASSKTRQPVQRFKKLFYRAAVRGDMESFNELLEEKSLETFGIASIDAVCNLYAKCPTLWLYSFAASCKNPLHIAAKRGHVAVVERLLAMGFDANSLDKVSRVNFNLGLLFKTVTRLLLKTQDGSRSPLRAVFCSVLLPPLHGAVAEGHVDVVRLLLENGAANPNLLPRASFYHQSAVIPAIFLADDPEIVKLLVNKGANFLHVATTTLSGLASSTYATALQRSALTQRTATTEYLLSCGADVALTPLHAAAAADNTRTVRRLLRRRPRRSASARDSVDARGERVEGVQRRTPLHWAAVVGRGEAAKELLDRGADPNARDRYGRTPLHWAARNNHPQVVSLLLEKGADASAEDEGGVPVLSFAAEADGVEPRVILALLDHGASLKHQLPGSGDTPLHIALQRENRETAKSLIRCGADLMASNNDGKRAVDVTTSTKLQFELKKEAGTRDIMISYPHSHFAFAQRVREYLETHGKLTCWMDTMDPSGIGGGAVWREEIARGIHNCSLVVSIVCGGYTKSEWCLKELALAKMIRKPVVALMVEPLATSIDLRDCDDSATNTIPASAIDAFVPQERRLAFDSFIRGTRVSGKSVELDVDESALEEAWRNVLPLLKNAMQTPEHGTDRWLKTESTMSSTSSHGGGRGGRRLYSQTDSEPEREDEDSKSVDGDRNEDEERKTDSQREGDDETGSLASSIGVGGAKSLLSVAVYSTIPRTTLSKRLVHDLTQEGFHTRSLTLSAEDTLPQLVQQLLTYRVLVVVIESLGFEASRDDRQAAGGQLTMLLRAATTAGVNVLPIVARDEFLSFSNLYTLARSELLYFVSGAGEKQSTTALLRQLRRTAERNE